jgi:hypothetical protein
VKPKYLFLPKFLGYSLVLFIFGHQLVDGYAAVLGFIIHTINPQYPLSPDLGKLTYTTSLTMIAFVAMILSTPKIPVRKKAGFILLGLFIFLLVDFFGIQYIVFPHGRFRWDESTPVVELYSYSKWFVPFVLWIMMSYRQMGELLRPEIKNAPSEYACPICEEPHADVITHIREAHGEKSLKKKKVRTFISEHPALSVDNEASCRALSAER